MPEAIISTRPHGGDWTVIGRGRNAPGSTPDGVNLSATTAGPESLTFTVRRPHPGPWDDLAPLVETRVEVPGAGTVWAGRINETTPGDNGAISVSARGWQYALDDDLWRKLWVRDRLEGFQDVRTIPGAAAGVWVDPGIGAYVDTQAALVLGWDFDKPLGTGQRAGVVLDLGATTAEAMFLDWSGLIGGTSNVTVYIRGADDALLSSGTSDAGSWDTGALGSSGQIGGNFASGKRYVGVFLESDTTFTTGSTLRFPIISIRVYGDSTYHDGSTGYSEVLASMIVGEVRAALPWLSADTTGIQTTVTTIKHLDTEGGYETHRQSLQRVNAYHDYLLGVDERRRLFFRERPSYPSIAIGARSGEAAFQDAGDNVDELFNKVIVNGKDPSGTAVQASVTATSGPLAIAGTTRTRVLEVGASIALSDATDVGTEWLRRRSTKPTRGSIQLRGQGAAWWAETGVPIHPASTLRMCGELVRFGDRINPDTGGLGREAVIQAVTYDPVTDTATLTLDGSRDHLDALMARVGMLQATRPPL